MKKLFSLALSVLVLFGALFTGVFAAEPEKVETDPIQVIDAKIIEKGGKNYFSVSLQNTTKGELTQIQCYAVIQNEDLIFAEATMASLSGYAVPYADFGAIQSGDQKTALYELTSCNNPKANVTLLIGYLPIGGDTVIAGVNYEELVVEDVLNKNFSSIDTNPNDESKGPEPADDEKETSKLGVIENFLKQTGFYQIFGNWKVLVMLLISFVLIYLAIVKKFEPLLLLPIAFGMLLTNLPGAEMYHPELFANGEVHWSMFDDVGAGLLDYLYLGIKLGIYPCLIFLGIGAMTDFGPLIANPKSLLLGAAAQLGIFATYIGATYLGFLPTEASSIGIIGGADGPTAIFVTSKLAPHLLGPIAVAAYSYMALVPFIQPPIMKALTTKKERSITMKALRPGSKTEKMLFPIAVTVFVVFLVPSAAPLVGCLMLGNLMRESGVVDRIAKAAQNELMNIVTIFLGVSVGATATADAFLDWNTLKILGMGIVAFGCGTAGGVLLAKFMNLFTKNKINPLIGSAGVSAVPMAARVSQTVGQKENPSNFLLMHAMGPNVAGVIGSAIAAGVLIALFG